MTVKEYAESKAVTTGAIYKAVSRSGHSMKELTDKKGQITGKGLSILREIYPDEQEPDQEPLSEPLKETRPEDSALDDLRARLSEAQERAEKWERLYLELQDRAAQEREAAEKEREQYKILLQTEQGLRIKAERNIFQRVKVFFLGEKTKPIESVGSVDAHGEVK